MTALANGRSVAAQTYRASRGGLAALCARHAREVASLLAANGSPFERRVAVPVKAAGPRGRIETRVQFYGGRLDRGWTPEPTRVSSPSVSFAARRRLSRAAHWRTFCPGIAA